MQEEIESIKKEIEEKKLEKEKAEEEKRLK